MSIKKELHMATSLEGLKRISSIPDTKTKKLQTLLESGKKIFKAAERYYHDGDEELAYVFYMKYFMLLNSIHKKAEYPDHKSSVRQAFGSNRENTLIMDRLEMLQDSLKRRYNGLNDTTNDVNSSSLPKKMATNANVIEMNELPTTISNTITCKQLFAQIHDKSVLIMDCRPSSDYNQSHLTYEWAFNVPEEYIVKGMSAGKLQDKLDNNAKVLWSARSVKDNVVIVDWNTESEADIGNGPSAILLDILQNWDPDSTYRSQIKILLRGYKYFIMMYPTLCTNPAVQAPDKSPTLNGDLIDDIEYPSIHDITMKDEIRERGFNLGKLNKVGTMNNSVYVATNDRPMIDRTSKLGAIKTYEQKAIVEIMKEHEELLHTAQANDEKLKQATKKLETLYEEKSDGGKAAIRNTEEKELLFNLMQLDSAAEDDKTKTNYLLEQLEMYKKIIFDQQDQISTSELEQFQEYIKKVELKLHERQVLNQKREMERQEREIQLAAVRGHKNHNVDMFANDDDNDEHNTQAKRPQFDRSTKPNIDALSPPNIMHYRERPRDFSPVTGDVGQGLCGLKNLGNTCYMNSILQCLSNTPQLTEYCLTDKYADYICRSNKTAGQIVEEFAALIKVMWEGKYKCVSSKVLHSLIGQYNSTFSGMEQQDSHEFLTIIIDWMHSDLQTLRAQVKPRLNMSASERAWLDFTKCKESLILHLFYGQIKSTVKCVECSKESATYESFSNLSLELPTDSNVCNLYQCMDMYFSGELIHGWNCPSCKQKRNAIKKLDISKWPPVLVVHLKRFHAESDCGNFYKKKQNYVQFPLENLDITSYIAKSESRADTPKTYQLYSVSNHYGSMESGHYTAFSKNGFFDRWFKFDDSMVTPLDSSSVVSSAAYILFYTWLPPIQFKSNS